MVHWVAYSLIIVILSVSLNSSNAQIAPALFVFGDSLVDVGNNNYLTFTIAKANLPHYGVDFPTHNPSGRFSNGFNAADFLAHKIGLPSPPPYLALKNIKSNDFFKGVSFASAAAGILNETNRYIDLPPFVGLDKFSQFTIPMDEQLEYYAEVHKILVQKLGESVAAKHLAQSLFAVVIGSTDIGEYLKKTESNHMKKGDFHQQINLMLSTIRRQLKKIYHLGARKFVMMGIGAIGCIPSLRIKTENEDCNVIANYWASNYNKGLQILLETLKSELEDFQYSYFNSYDFFLNIIQNQHSYGFKEVKVACCGLGKLNAEVACDPVSSLCSNRKEYLFWDLYHPTEAATRIIVEAIFDYGSQQYSFPVNVRQLLSDA